MGQIENILKNNIFTLEDLEYLLGTKGSELKTLFEKARETKRKEVGNTVYFRGLIELSNVCKKDCFYCGIRHSNTRVQRYNLTDIQVLEAAKFAFDNHYGSVVIQSGENSSQQFINRIEKLIKQLKKLSENKLGITLSLGEQTIETYKKWFDAGAHRYLLRIETSDKELYEKLHPIDHSFENRLKCLQNIKEIGFQTGTGVMIGLPFQTIKHLANDLLFLKNFDVDMVGMGPYLEHRDTPLYEHKKMLWPIQTRFEVSLKMVAILRIMMKDINIAATTALQAIDPIGREKAIDIGANIIMPNITPGNFRNEYALYDNKPCTTEAPDDCNRCLDARISLINGEIGYKQWGDSKHFRERTKR
jgi:biotin synthase